MAWCEAELNSYIDALESDGRRSFEEGPEVGRRYQELVLSFPFESLLPAQYPQTSSNLKPEILK